MLSITLTTKSPNYLGDEFLQILKTKIENRLSLQYKLRNIRVENHLDELALFIKLDRNIVTEVSASEINNSVSINQVNNSVSIELINGNEEKDEEEIEEELKEKQKEEIIENIKELVKDAVKETIKNYRR